MKSSAYVFLAAFFVLAGSWGGFVLAPQIQLGLGVQVKTTGSGNLYPLPRTGLATRGADVYRANGCVYCHSQQVGQDEIHCEVVLTESGTNVAATAAAIAKLNPELGKDAAATLASLPKAIIRVSDVNAAEVPSRRCRPEVARLRFILFPQVGTSLVVGVDDVPVAQDYLSDSTVQLGSRRVGPDLANVGSRLPDVNWQLIHLYAPTALVKDSTMPSYRFLFEKRKVGSLPSAEALKFPAGFAPEAGFEIVPTEQARALTAYLVSLQADAPLYEAPVTVASLKPANSSTNSAAK